VSSELSFLCSAWFQFLMAIGTESKYTSERLEIFSLEKNIILTGIGEFLANGDFSNEK